MLFNTDLLAFQSDAASSLPSFATPPAFPTSDYYEGSAPPQGHQPTASLPTHGGRPGDGSHVHQTIDRRGRRPAFPLQPRHKYAAAFPHGLRASREIPATESRAHNRTGVRCVSAHICQVRADASLKGVLPLVRSRYTFPSRLPDPGRLAVPTRPVVVRAAPAHALRFQDRAAPSFSDPLRRATGRYLNPLDHSTPRGAPRAQSAPGQVAEAAKEKPGLEAHRAKTTCPAWSPKAPVPVTRAYGPSPQTATSKTIFMPRGALAAEEARSRGAAQPPSVRSAFFGSNVQQMGRTQ